MKKLDNLVTDSLKENVERILRDFLGENHLEDIDNLSQRIVDSQGFYCRCQSCKCAPHRCWPSRFAWGFIIGLFLLIWVLVGNNYTDRNNMYGKWEAAWNTASAQRWGEIDARLAKHEKVISEANDFVEFYRISEPGKYRNLKLRIEKLEKNK